MWKYLPAVLNSIYMQQELYFYSAFAFIDHVQMLIEQKLYSK